MHVYFTNILYECARIKWKRAGRKDGFAQYYYMIKCRYIVRIDTRLRSAREIAVTDATLHTAVFACEVFLLTVASAPYNIAYGFVCSCSVDYLPFVIVLSDCCRFVFHFIVHRTEVLYPKCIRTLLHTHTSHTRTRAHDDNNNEKHRPSINRE